jgi:hypothetical protein
MRSLLILTPMLALALAGCDALDTASNTLDKAQVCSKAISAAGYTPDLTNPTKSVQEAQQRADELRKLAEQTSDADLQRQLRELADQMGTLKAADVNPSGVASWASTKLEQLNDVQRACA